jgi:hypothetical protein
LAAEGAYAWPQIAAAGTGRVHLLWDDLARGDAWWHRWGDEEEWTRAEQVPGLSGAPGPIGVAVDGTGTLHVAALGWDRDGAPTMLYLTWMAGRWGAREAHPLGLNGVEEGLSAALQPATGQLETIVRGSARGDEAARVALWHTGRALAAGEGATAEAPVSETPVSLPGPAATATPAAEATAVPQASAAPEATPTPQASATPGAAPTATLDLGAAPSSGGDDVMGIPLPLLLGGGLAALIVAGAFGARRLWATRR